MNFIRTIPPERIKGKMILEVGSKDINGSVRPTINEHQPAFYEGIDIQQGNGVDRVMDAGEMLGYYHEDLFDLVISTEALEHIKDWKMVVTNMKRVLHPQGWLVITTRSPGFAVHEYPSDYWRFTKEDFEAIFSDMKIVELQNDPEIPGVFLIAEKQYDNVLNNLDNITPMDVNG
jgi:SAM-dependent methyltransferase